MNLNLEEITKQLINEFKLQPFQVENAVKLLDEGNTVPFIARYRKEATGEMDDQTLRELMDRLVYLRGLAERKQDVLRIINDQGKLTDEIVSAVSAAATMTEVEDIYRPYKQKRRTRATVAREKGLEPLAELLLAQDLYKGDIDELAAPFLNEENGVLTTQDALAGAMDIIAEQVSDNAEFRKHIRELTIRQGRMVSSAAKEEESVYEMYYDFSEPVARIANHRVLALDRGEKEGFLAVKIDIQAESITEFLLSRVLAPRPSITTEYVETAALDAYKRLIAPSIENEVRNMLTERAGEEAIKLFALNLKNLLLQPPVKGNTVLGFDPGYRTGCKMAVVDPTGRVKGKGVVYCTLPNHDKPKAREQLRQVLEKMGVTLVAIGNGTASKESELFMSELIGEMDRPIYYMMVNEAGASVYSASKLGAEEFPDFDVSLRSAVSIARRVQDPLAELVKIDPKSIGIGQYQHDMNQKRLGEALGGVVESCVNSVGVELNTASAPLLSHVAGINETIAKNIVKYREENGTFATRKQLMKVARLGPAAFKQCAGFIRIMDAKEILDRTSVHPESYEAAHELLTACGYSAEDVAEGRLSELKTRMDKGNMTALCEKHNIGMPTLRDIADALLKPGRDPRDELPKPVLRTDVMSIEDLKPGMILTGTVRNVIDFGAFVDIGVHQDGLVHISEISDKYIKHPTEVLAVGDVVQIMVKEVDTKRQRISLSMKGVGRAPVV